MKLAKPVLGTALITAFVLSFQPMAYADTQLVPSDPEETADADYVILDPRTAVVSEQGEFFPVGAVDEDTTLVVLNEDGSLPAGLSQQGLEALLESSPESLSRNGKVEVLDSSGAVMLTPEVVSELNGSPSLAAAPVFRSYSARLNTWSTYTGGGIWGTTDTTTAYYYFTVQAESQQEVNGQGYGYYKGYNGSEMGVWGKWYAIGVARDGHAKGRSVPWGKTLAPARFQAKSVASLYANGYFLPG